MSVTMHDSRLTVPNVMTVLRMVMAIVAGVFFAGEYAERVAVVLCVVAALLDVFDGWYARAFSQCSTLGKHLDPLADKLLMGVVYGVLAVKCGSAVVWVLVAFIGLRELGMTIFRAYSLRRHGRFIPANGLGKLKMVVQSVFGLTVIASSFFLEHDLAFDAYLLVPGLCLILAISYVSAIIYIRLWYAARKRARLVGGKAGAEYAEDAGRMVVGK